MSGVATYSDLSIQVVPVGNQGVQGPQGVPGSLSTVTAGSLSAPAVAIGETSSGWFRPTAGEIDLTLLGTLAARASLTSGNFSFGTDALLNPTTGQHNIALGVSTLQSLTTGNANAGFGMQSLFDLTTGTGNTALGTNTGRGITTGSYNTILGGNVSIGNVSNAIVLADGQANIRADYGFTRANGWTLTGDAVINGVTVGLGFGSVTSNVVVGFDCLASNVSGGQNVAIGQLCLQSNTTGAQNVAIGYSALQANTTGFQNVAIGLFALTANTTGIQNIAISPFYALGANTTGNFNVAIGIGSLQANTTGSSNVAINGALSTNTTGSSNTAVGPQAMNDNTTGSFNSAFGQQALFNNVGGSYNTAFGLTALYNLSAPGSGTLGITGSQNTGMGALSLTDLGFYLSAGNFVTGNSYTIYTVGTTNYIAIGASANTVGTTFTATGPGSGTGVALPNVAINGNSALGYASGRGILYGINNTILGANITGLGAGLTGAVILGSGDGVIHLNYNQTNSAAWTFAAPVVLKTYTVAGLPAAGVAGRTAYATNCRVFNGAGAQEGVGAGTGGMVHDNGTAWKIAGTNVTAIA